MRNKDIIVIGQQGWDLNIGSNAHNIATVFAQNNRVIYVNPPLDINSLLRTRQKSQLKKHLSILLGRADSLVKEADNLWIYTPGILCLSNNWLSSSQVFRSLNYINNKLFAQSISQTIKKLDFKEFLLFNDGLMFLGLELKALLQPVKYIYYVRDYLIATPYFKKHGTWAEAELITKADLVVANSLFLAEYASQYNANSYDIGQGCELNFFNPSVETSVPADMVNLHKPIIGYVGNITTSRLDINLLEQLATSRPNWTFAMVGFEDDDFKASRLHKKANVHFLGTKAPEELPSYIQHFDVCINPQLVNEITIGNYPRKIDEYLAMGKPTVATKTKAMQLFENYTYLGSSSAEYITLIQRALSENSNNKAEERIAFARSHTWEASVQAIYDLVHQVAPTDKAVSIKENANSVHSY
ncbi:glycosyl transferase family 1 [Adhaeribacter arboris]|uniref:Glycosyl transferase family 1 n=1 Tax=Adhaeribacter arboris TaxID=2072846 RepID=A0A2T2YMC8_9BACT|nr:glycosyltransferase [Adhaeribacter arboris]PSR56659.1 glycosyl transferase family 1 [Adhaeribacter arboris]